MTREQARHRLGRQGAAGRARNVEHPSVELGVGQRDGRDGPDIAEEVGGEGRGTHARDDEASSCCLRLRSRMRIPKRPLPHARGRHCTACVDTKAAQPHDDLDPSRFCSCKEVAARLGHFICREALGQTEEDTGSAFKRWTQSLRAGDISLHDSESRVSQKLVFRDFA
eukprot:CAMPEP_0177617822 /NCGR_PEP_ID=MMETSP0419_2-20121207/25161_1 /TAXON_ID=582737 /ORGANISM="Tetraselmis sp., Strain GSL018" /LENGTH=167 /DNA_ID=CAMNT_0019116507 /DNA_START=355 /DNA_END=854 /DNA_ORIENTATION=+